VLAYVWNVLSRSYSRPDDVEKRIFRHDNDHSFVLYYRRTFPGPLVDRDSVTRMLWKAIDDGFIMVTSDIEDPAFPQFRHVVRGHVPAAFKITAARGGQSRLECEPPARASESKTEMAAAKRAQNRDRSGGRTNDASANNDASAKQRSQRRAHQRPTQTTTRARARTATTDASANN
jgi:hypothetical protein